MHGLVLLDEDEEVVRPAILWNDQRTAAECDVIRETVGRERFIAITGNEPLTGFTAGKLLWVREHEPEAWARARHMLLPKDYVRLKLTGEHALDVADGAGTVLFDLAARTWSGEVVEALGLDPAMLPRTVEGPDVVGFVTAQAAAAAPGCEPARRSSAGQATRPPTPSAWAPWCPASAPCRWGPRGSSSCPRPARPSSPRDDCTPSVTRSRARGTSWA